MNESYMVYVSCMTYNQSSYIEEALDGFCIQQTDFPFVCGIIDDASTDDEPLIIQKYLDNHFDLQDGSVVQRKETEDYYRVFAQHKTNKNCFFVVVFLKYNHYQLKKSKVSYVSEWRDNAKYLAICEGDDYWIDSTKLQKQVGFMDAHPEHSLCFCAHQCLLPSGESIVEKRYESDMEICPIEDVILGGGGYMATNSMLLRRSLYVSYLTWAPGCPIGDLPMMLSLAAKGKVGYLHDIMCVYRVSASGSWSVRMASTIKKRRQHHRAIIKMWHQFDSWTDRAYHKTVMKKIRLNKKNHLKDELVTIKNKLLKK